MLYAMKNCQCDECDNVERFHEKNETSRKHAIHVAELLQESEMVTLIVGPQKTRRSQVLTWFSFEFFASAFYGPFHESSVIEIELPEGNEKGMRAFIAWTFTGDIDRCHEELRTREIEEHAKIIARLWVPGDRIIAPRFCNEAMHVLCHDNWYSGANTVDYIYSNTTQSSILRKCIVDWLVIDDPNIFTGRSGNKFDPSLSSWIRLIAKGGDFMIDYSF